MYFRLCKKIECNSIYDKIIILLNELYGKNMILLKGNSIKCMFKILCVY